MARTEGFRPDIPPTYRGVEVCDHVAYRWETYEGSMWRMGVDNALDSVLKDLDNEMEYWGGGFYPYMDDYASGIDEGKERAADNIRDAVSTYKKESK
ncbi:hypothetical protein SEA_LUCKYSOCKE_155 [Streptomyces phage LuckySocke]|nr:hypothetical protein SEA_LUCKYSOCKE_155 [Streptomyces phage LuckySocke]